MNPRSAFLPLACLGAATCSPAPPDSPVAGLWSRSEAACALGFGVRFARDAVLLISPDGVTPMLDRVRYSDAADAAGGFSFTVRFRFGDEGGGALVFRQEADGRLVLTQQRFDDVRTGSTRIAIDPEAGALSTFARLTPCDAADLKGVAPPAF